MNVTVNLDLSNSSTVGSLGAGYNGTGSLAIRGGTVVNATTGYLGFNAGSTGVATVDVHGSTGLPAATSTSAIAAAGRSRSRIGAAFRWVARRSRHCPGTAGVMDFDNNGGTLTTQSLLASPSQLAGTCTINTRELVSNVDLVFDSTHALKRTFVIQQSGLNATINLDMATNPSTNGALGAGWEGAGSLTIQDGINVSSSYGYLGYGNGSTGVATVSGKGSTWTPQWLVVGNSGTATLNISHGGIVNGSGCNIGSNAGSYGTVTVDGSGSTWTNGTQIIYVGNYGNGTLKVLNGGSVSSGLGYIGESAGATGVVTVDGVGSTWANTNNYVYVGDWGGGTLSITNHGSVVASGGSIGQSANSSGVAKVDGAGSNWTNSSSISVGVGGSGALWITSGGSVSSSYGYLGYNTGSMGVVTVNGGGSTWNAGGLRVGGSGSGTLSISNGGHVNDSLGGYNSGDYIAYYAGSTGTVTVDGIGSTWANNSTLYIGVNGTGALSITSGGSVSDTTGGSLGHDATASAYIGYGSTGLVTVDGTGSTWTNSGSLYVGCNGTGTLNITTGGSVTATGTTYVGNGYSSSVGIGAINFGANGGTLTTQSLFVSPTQLAGTGTINTRGFVSDTNLVFDSTHSANQTFIINQSGQNIAVNLDVSNSSNVGGLGAGYDRAGSLTIRDGVVVSSAVGYLGCNTGSAGVATVDGLGSTWTNNGTLCVGYNGNGTLSVANGGTVNNSGDFYVGTYAAGTLKITNGGSVSNGTGYIAYQCGGTCAVTVDGTGSKWTNSGSLYVGYYGTQAILNITNGGTVTSSGSDLGDFSGSTGVVTVDSAGSTWADSGGISVNGTLSITNGGSVSSSGSSGIGYRANSTAMVTVCGARSTWTSGSLSVGGTLSITNGGNVSDSGGYIAGYNWLNGRGHSGWSRLNVDQQQPLCWILRRRRDALDHQSWQRHHSPRLHRRHY